MAAQVWRAGTRATARSHIANHIGPALGNRQLATITRTDVQAFVASLTAKGLAPTTVQGIHVRLVSIFEAAVHDGKIVRSPRNQNPTTQNHQNRSVTGCSAGLG